MIIKNINSLATTRLRKAALDIIEAGIIRVLPSIIMKSALSFDKDRKILRIYDREYSTDGGRIFVVGGGKAAGLMAEELENLLGYETITDGVLTCKDNHFKTRLIKVVQAGHPIPDQRGVDAVKRMFHFKQQYAINAHDLVLCLISGGGSSLMPYPADGITLEDKQGITELLLASGADILEINTVRKHLSKVKGGRLRQFFSPGSVISLILSDVIGNDLGIIASGPTVADSSTFADAKEVLEKYNLLAKVPDSILELFRKGCRGQIEETPKILDNCSNYIIGDNNLALQAMAQKASEIGFRPRIISAEQKGDTMAVARYRAKEIISSRESGYNVFILGGETTLKLPDVCGTGGRNQQYAVVSMLAMQDYPGEWVIASVGTDGSDYLPDVAGAIVDSASLHIASEHNLEIQGCIDDCDSYPLLKKLGNALIETGGTGTNVGDVIVYLTS